MAARQQPHLVFALSPEEAAAGFGWSKERFNEFCKEYGAKKIPNSNRIPVAEINRALAKSVGREHAGDGTAPAGSILADQRLEEMADD